MWAFALSFTLSSLSRFHADCEKANRCGKLQKRKTLQCTYCKRITKTRKKIARVHAVNVCMSSKNHQFRHRQVILQKYDLGIIFCASLYRIGSATRIRSYDQPVNGFKGTVLREKGDRPAAEFFFHMRRCLRPKQLSPNISAIPVEELFKMAYSLQKTCQLMPIRVRPQFTIF